MTRCGLLVIEDCAHTLGAKWKLDSESTHRHLGTFGDVAVWSLQTNKSINAGEGGLISTARQDVASYITVATGSYGHYAMNGASGDLQKVQQTYTSVPNMSMRMTTFAAAIALPQLDGLPGKLDAWERHAHLIRDCLGACSHVRIIKQEHVLKGKLVNVWSSIQFELVDFSDGMVEDVLKRLSEQGINLAWFGGPCKGFTSTLRDWKFADPEGEQWSRNAGIKRSAKSLVDLPLYHTASWGDHVIKKLAEVITGTVTSVAAVAQKLSQPP